MGIALTLFVVGLVAGAFANSVALDTSVETAAANAPSGGLHAVRSLRLPIIQIVTGALFATTPLVVGVSWTLPAYLWFVWLTVTLMITDLDSKLIPNRILFPGTAVGAVLLLLGAFFDGQPEAIVRAAGGGIASFLVLYVVARLARGDFGLGDVKLALLLGMFTAFQGWEELVVGLFAAFILGGVVSIVLLVTGSRHRKDSIPFGPFLVAGAYLALAWGSEIASWYTATSP
jgi:leader peptidase (prepilin peptidase)/N-methyltransferase